MSDFDVQDRIAIIHDGWWRDRVNQYVEQRPCQKRVLFLKRGVRSEAHIEDDDFVTREGQPYSRTVRESNVDEVPCPECGNPIRNQDIQAAITESRNANTNIS